MTASLPDLLASRARLDPDAVALEEIATGRVLTYAELDARASRAAGLLAARGLEEGDRVGILCRNRIAFWELLFGCARIGAVLVPLNWRMPASELAALVADAEPSLIVHDAAFGQSVAGMRALTVDLDTYEDEMASAAPRSGGTRWAEQAIWYLLYTSGTTGRPKGVIYTFRMALANFVSIGAATGLRKGDAVPCFLPNFHTAGINLHALPALFAGGRALLLDSFDAEAVVTLLERQRIDLMFAVPFVYQELIAHPRFAAAPLERVRHWGCGGAPLPDRLAGRCREIGIRLCNGMGMTETGPTALLIDPADAWARIGSVGKPQLLCQARVAGPDGRDVTDGEVGELLFAGPAVTPGYWRNGEATRAAFTDDGWLRSGDLVRRDADGFYHVAGRRKEMYVSGGENVYPAEVEQVLVGHPAVIDAAVLPVPDGRWGEVGHAFVQLAPNAHRLPPEELSAYCRARLAAYKVPKAFRFVDDFPRTSGGKIQKHLLAAAAPQPVQAAWA